jgi:hypothetical protein
VHERVREQPPPLSCSHCFCVEGKHLNGATREQGKIEREQESAETQQLATRGNAAASGAELSAPHRDDG